VFRSWGPVCSTTLEDRTKPVDAIGRKDGGLSF
jgi:hypothetical protein